MIEMVFANITTADGKIMEHTPMFDEQTSLSKCLEEKRKVSQAY